MCLDINMFFDNSSVEDPPCSWNPSLSSVNHYKQRYCWANLAQLWCRCSDDSVSFLATHPKISKQFPSKCPTFLHRLFVQLLLELQSDFCGKRSQNLNNFKVLFELNESYIIYNSMIFSIVKRQIKYKNKI